MELIKALIEKFVTPKDFVFENFIENLEQNQLYGQKEFEKMYRFFNSVANRKEIKYFLPNVLKDIDNLKFCIKEQTASESFSFNFSHIVNCAKMFAVNYMATDKGKTYKEVKLACERLSSMLKCMNFIYFAHIKCETPYSVDYKDDVITVNKNCYASRLVEMVITVNNIISQIANGIYNKDRNLVYAGFVDLCDDNLYQFNEIINEVDDL